MLTPILAIVIGVTAPAALAWRWGPPEGRWALADVFAVFAMFVGVSGLCGSAFAKLWGSSWVPETIDLLPGLAGTALSSVAVAALILRRASPGPLGLGLSEAWAWGVALAGIPAFLVVSAAYEAALSDTTCHIPASAIK